MDVTGADPHALLVVGESAVANALSQIAFTLGWTSVVVNSLEDTKASLDGVESVVVLSHHEGLDGPAIAAALSSNAGYIGAMGSRGTQERRRQWLRDNGVPEEQVSSVRGPAGLDIGSDTPAEIAVSIVAEIISVRRGVRGGSLSERSGAIHPDLPPGTAECPAG